MRDIGSDARCAPDVEERQVRHKRVLLEQERQRLADTTCTSNDTNLPCQLIEPNVWSLIVGQQSPSRESAANLTTMTRDSRGEALTGSAEDGHARVDAGRRGEGAATERLSC